jgi:hypothetical protein
MTYCTLQTCVQAQAVSQSMFYGADPGRRKDLVSLWKERMISAYKISMLVLVKALSPTMVSIIHILSELECKYKFEVLSQNFNSFRYDTEWHT